MLASANHKNAMESTPNKLIDARGAEQDGTESRQRRRRAEISNELWQCLTNQTKADRALIATARPRHSAKTRR